MLERDRGQVVPFLALLLVVVAVALAVVVRVAAASDRAARARTAADAAALAGVADGCDAARRLATANGATLETCTPEGRTVTVEVRVDDVRARARATASVVWELDHRPRRQPLRGGRTAQRGRRRGRSGSAEVGPRPRCRRLLRCPTPLERAVPP